MPIAAQQPDPIDGRLLMSQVDEVHGHCQQVIAHVRRVRAHVRLQRLKSQRLCHEARGLLERSRSERMRREG
jgi:hypothetical protein